MTRNLFIRKMGVLTVFAAGMLVFAETNDGPVFAPSNGVAIRGYDAVAYFEESKPVKGSPEFTHTWNGAVWQFATAARRDAFAQNPERYAPQYGGYCAFGMSRGYKAPTDADAWSVVNGRLYLNYDKGVQKTWTAKQEEFIRKADSNWPRVRDGK